MDLKTKRKRTRTRALILAVTLFLLTVVYALADRYLIEHVEQVVPTEQASASPETADGESEASLSPGTGTENSDGNTQEDSAEATYDDWNYQSEDLTISIQKVEQGSGSDKITYYVADVQFADVESLKSAFAKNSFGRNIIEDTSVIAESNDAIFAINGDYYGFRNDGVIIRNGVVYRDVPTRTGLAILDDGTLMSYDETEISSEELLEMGVVQTLSFGPVLVKDGAAVEDFGKVAIDTNIGNRSIQNSNPRTGIGMISANHFVFIVVDGRSSGYSRGMTLEEFAQTFADLGCTQAYNLDGGGSSTMYFMGRVVNNPLGKGSERGVSDILYVDQ